MRDSFSGLNVDHVWAIARCSEETRQLFCIVPEKLGCILAFGLDLHLEAVAGKPHSDRYETEFCRLQLKIQNPENPSGCPRQSNTIQTVVLSGWLLRPGDSLDIFDNRACKMLQC